MAGDATSAARGRRPRFVNGLCKTGRSPVDGCVRKTRLQAQSFVGKGLASASAAWVEQGYCSGKPVVIPGIECLIQVGFSFADRVEDWWGCGGGFVSNRFLSHVESWW